VANKPTDLDRPLRSVGLGVSSLPVGRRRSVWISSTARLGLMVLRDLLDDYSTYTLKWEVDELEKTVVLMTKGF
jgi:hypothetical protein